MNDLFTAVVCVTLFILFGYYKAEYQEAIKENQQLRDSLNISVELVRDSCHTQKQINLRYRQFISGKQERMLVKDSSYLYLIDKQ